MSEIKEQMLNIAASLFICPATEEELMQRDFLKNKSIGGVQRFIMWLEKDAIYYKGETMHIKKDWAKKNLQGYELDFRTDKQKYIDSLTPFARKVYGL
jgi:hypothetical protein